MPKIEMDIGFEFSLRIARIYIAVNIMRHSNSVQGHQTFLSSCAASGLLRKVLMASLFSSAVCIIPLGFEDLPQ